MKHNHRWVEVMNVIGHVRMVIVLLPGDTIEMMEKVMSEHPPFQGVRYGPVLDKSPRIRHVWFYTLRHIEAHTEQNWLT